MQGLEKAGISMKAATDKLTEDGVKLFADAFDKLLAAVAQQKAAPLGGEQIMNTSLTTFRTILPRP